jgi:[ribosomal protein S5]-alanine N-acetyltransferase
MRKVWRVNEYLIQTERLRLRPYRGDDLDTLAAILGDPETMRFYPRPFTRDESAAWIERVWIERNRTRYETEGLGLWAIEIAETGEFIGNCGPTRQTVERTEEIELGWHIAKQHWNRGFATEAAAACRDRCFETLGIDRLIALVRPVNVPSARVAEKIGMRVEREAPFHDLLHRVYVLTPNDVASTGG